MFWFANKLGTAYRFADGKDVLNKLMGTTKTPSAALSTIIPSFHQFDLLVGMCGTALIYAVVYFKGKNAKKYRKDVEYGSARWGTPKDIKPCTIWLNRCEKEQSDYEGIYIEKTVE